MKGMTAIVFSIWAIFLFLGIPIAAGSASTEDPYGSIQSVQAMHQGRFNHTATALADNRVLATGGTSDGYISLRSAEIFDPAKGRWDQAPDMLDPRMRHTSDLLPSGDVLVAGGFYGNGHGHPSGYFSYNGPGNVSLDRCEIYDRSTGRFRSVSPMITGRFWHRAAPLPDGRILVIGGVNVTHRGLTSCEIYDPLMDEWTSAGSLTEPRARFAATVLQNGSIMVTGGHNGTFKGPVATCEIYVPLQDRWSRIASMNDPRGFHSALLLPDGRVMVSGGFASSNATDTSGVEIYDPTENMWLMTGHLGTPRHSHFMVLTGSGGVIAYGGSSCTEFYCTVSGLEYFDPLSAEWVNTYVLVLGRKWPAEAMLPDGRFLICGGQSCNEAQDAADIYYPPGHIKKNNSEDPGMDRTYIIIGALVLASLVLVGFRFVLPRLFRPS